MAVKAAPAPSDFSRELALLFLRAQRQLRRQGSWTDTDRPLLVDYCRAIETAQRARHGLRPNRFDSHLLRTRRRRRGRARDARTTTRTTHIPEGSHVDRRNSGEPWSFPPTFPQAKRPLTAPGLSAAAGARSLRMDLRGVGCVGAAAAVCSFGVQGRSRAVAGRVGAGEDQRCCRWWRRGRCRRRRARRESRG